MIKARDLNLGGIDRFENTWGRCWIYKEHGTIHVRLWVYSLQDREWECFSACKPAIKKYNEFKKHLKGLK